MILYFIYNVNTYDILGYSHTESDCLKAFSDFTSSEPCLDDIDWIALNISETIKSNVMFKSFTEQVDKEKFAKLLKKVGKLK